MYVEAQNSLLLRHLELTAQSRLVTRKLSRSYHRQASWLVASGASIHAEAFPASSECSSSSSSINGQKSRPCRR